LGAERTLWELSPTSSRYPDHRFSWHARAACLGPQQPNQGTSRAQSVPHDGTDPLRRRAWSRFPAAPEPHRPMRPPAPVISTRSNGGMVGWVPPIEPSTAASAVGRTVSAGPARVQWPAMPKAETVWGPLGEEPDYQRKLDPGCYRCSSVPPAELSPPFPGPLKSPTVAAFRAPGLGVRGRNERPILSPNGDLSPKLGAWPIYSTSFFR
jgi:hypothetical protein